MKHLLHSASKAFLLLCLLAAAFLQGRELKAQTSLAAGDLVFTGYNSNASPAAGDTFAFVLLTNISANTQISFTDRGYNGSGWVGAGSTEGTVTWTTGSALPWGTEIYMCGLSARVYNPVSGTFSTNGSVTLTEGTSPNGLSISNVGDQFTAFQGGGGSITGGSVTIIAGLHFLTCNANTSTATWDGAGCTIGPNSSIIPPGLTGGVNAFYTGTMPGGILPTIARFNCTGTPASTPAQIRTAVMNQANWTLANSSLSMPSKCVFVSSTPVISAHPQNRVICNNGSTTMSISAVGATSYQWYVNTGAGFSIIPAGAPYSGVNTATLTITGGTTAMNGYLYRCVATNGSGSATSNAATLTVVTVTTTGSSTNVSCIGGNNGTATVVASGGFAPYTYSWSPSGGTAATATNLTADNYSVLVTDNIGCQATRAFNITEPASGMSATISKTDISCNGGGNGTATVVVSGGTTPYTYSWSPSGGTNATATGLSQGTYTVTVTDNGGCQITRSITVNQPATALAGTISKTDVSCNGGSNGTATVIASGGTTPYTYSWSPSGGTNATATGLAANTYTVTVTDFNGCQITRSATVTQPATALAGTISKTDVSCNGGSNGTATVVASGGTTPYTYSWSPSGGTNATATGLAANTYTVTVTDFNGCQITRSATVTQPASALAGTISKTDVSCNGGSNGTATVVASGGTTPYTYSWSPSGGTNATATGLAANTYTVTVTDFNGCQITRSATVTQPASALAGTISKTDVSCNGGSNGTATVIASGGTTPYTYSWSPSGGTNATATGLAANTYTVTVTDFNGCQITRSATVTQPASALAGTISKTDVSCNGGSNGTATVVASGGTTPYTYSWSPSGGTNATATGLAIGTYTVTVTDFNGCQITRSATVTQPASALAGTISKTDVSCNGGSNGTATVVASGGTTPYTYSWSPSGGTAATATGLAANTYTVTVTDFNGCQITRSIAVSQPSAISITPSHTNVSCNGGNNGTATVSVSGGAGPYSYSWSPSGGTAATATGLAAGTYTVTVTDFNTCQATQNITVSQPSAISITPSHTNVSCNGGSNGTATATVSGGVGPYSYSWSPSGGTAATATGLAAGTYTVTVTDNNTCQATQSITVSQPSAISISASHTDVSCNGGSNGTATATVSGGTAPYSYSWAPSGGTAATATGLAAGTYTVTVTDNNTCQATQSYTIAQPTAMTLTSSHTDVSCNGGSNGTATVSVSGGAAPYSYSWAPSGGTAATATGLTAGTYTVTVTDNNTCQSTQSVTVSQPSAISIIPSHTDVSCNGGSNGTATATVSGGVGPYSYSWSPSGGTAATATGLAAGTYTVTVTDNNTCQATQSITVSQPSAISISASHTDVSCNGGANGTATVVASGGTAPYSYSWAPSGGTAATATGLSAGTYTVTVTDNNTCQSTQSVTVGQPSALALTASHTDVSCNGGANGTATVVASGGTAPYSYSWSPSGGTAATATGLSAGTYTVTVTDNNTCQSTQSVTVGQPSALALTASHTDVSCNGGANGTATVVASGGTAPYSYSWAPSGGTAATATGLSAGTYTVTVTDNNTCQSTQSVTVGQPSALALTASHTNVSCNGGANGTATVVASGGTAPYSYSWAPSGGTAATATGLAAGTYTVTVTDNNTCQSTQSVTVGQPSALALTASHTNVSCNGGANGTATVVASGGTAPYSYSWAPSGGTAATATGLAAGTYTVTVTDNNTCQSTQSVTVGQPSALALTASHTNVSCNGGANGTATVVASGGTAPYSYSWSPSGGTAATATGLSAGTYTVTVTDNNTCQSTQSVTVGQPSALSLTASHTDVSCNGGANGTATVVASGGTAPYSYSWAPSGGTAATATGLSAGTYTVTVTDNNTCQSTQSVTVGQPSALALTASHTDVSCNGGTNGTATVVASGGTAPYSYSWAPSGGTAATATGLAAGTYTVTVTDNNTCQSTQSVTVSEPTVLQLTPASANISCFGAADAYATVTVSGATAPYTYLWAPNGETTDSIGALSAGTYMVYVTDNNLCKDSVSFTITEPAELTAVLTHTDVSCTGNGADGQASVTINGGTQPYSINWLPGGQNTNTITDLAAGTYTANITDANGCTWSGSTQVNNPVPDTSSQNIRICFGQSYAIGNSIYTAAGEYEDTFITAAGCDSVVITYLSVDTVIVTIQNNDPVLTASGNGTTYQWINCANSQLVQGAVSEIFTASANGSYAVITTNNNGCADTSACENVIRVSLEENAAAGYITFYPNPTTGMLTMHTEGITIVRTELMDITGKVHPLIQQGNVLNLSALQNGVYLVRVTDAGGRQHTSRIVKM